LRRLPGGILGQIQHIHHQPIADPEHVCRRASLDREIDLTRPCGNRIDVTRWMGWRRDGHVPREVQRQIVARTLLVVRRVRGKLEDQPAEPGMIASPHLDRRSGFGPRRRCPQREHRQQHEAAEAAKRRWHHAVETLRHARATTGERG
jgi:hypothetical protein